MIFFLHIPKTAGTTFYEVVKNNHFQLLKPKIEDNLNQYFNESIVRNQIAIRLPGGYEAAPQTLNIIQELTDEKKQNISFIGGHIGFGFHKYFDGKVDYVCFVRNPRERIISDYKEHCKKGRFFYDVLSKNDFNFNIYLRAIKEHNLDNLFTRQLAGPTDFILRKRNPVDDSLFEKAQLNVKSVLFFEMEHFDNALYYLKDHFGWKNIKYQIKNQASTKQIDFEADEVLLQDVIKYDLKLYDLIEPIQYTKKTFMQRFFGNKS